MPRFMAHVVVPILLAAALLPASGGSGIAGDKGTLLIGRGDWCPYVCWEPEGGARIGYAAEMLQTIFQRAGYAVEFMLLNYSMGIELARQGEIALMSCMYSVDAPDLEYPNIPLGMSRNHFFVRKDAPWRFTGLDSLQDVRVGLVQNYQYPEFQEYIDTHPEGFLFMKGADPLVRNLEMLMLGRLDAVFDDRNVVLLQADRLGVRDKIVDAGDFGIENEVLVGFSPADPRTPELKRILEQGIQDLRTSGELARILDRYGVADWN
jgi:polar amino acid transport system substrate-binding protein